MYPPNSGYAIAQYPGGAPVAVPMQGGSGMVPVQTVTPGPQGGQPQMVMAPVSGMVGNQPQFAQIATSGAMSTGFQPQFAQVATPEAMVTDYQPQAPPTYRHGDYMKLENDDVRVIIIVIFLSSDTQSKILLKARALPVVTSILPGHFLSGIF